jgi:hypothetical protein
LGKGPTSYYEENGVTVIYAKPPAGLQGLTSHYGMLFAIDGFNVRWTPINQPNAWPAAFFFTFPAKPIALASCFGAVIVLCVDGVYRIDGSSPTALASIGTAITDGCLAPHSVQVTTDLGVLYLGRRGVMSIYDGMHARCLTDSKIKPTFWQATSYSAITNRSLIPTLSSHNYANLAYDDGIVNSITNGYAQHSNNPTGGTIRDIKSFVWNGKYFLYWTNVSGNYGLHTMVCIDLRIEGFPITTLPYKLRAAHVNESGRCFSILDEISTLQTSVWITREAHEGGYGGSFG